MLASQSYRWARTISFILIGVLFVAFGGLSGCGNRASGGESHTEPVLSNNLIRDCKPPAGRPAGMPPPPGMAPGQRISPPPGIAPPLEESSPSGASIAVGLDKEEKAVNFKLKDVYGNEFVLSKLLAEKPVVMVFGSFT